MINFALMFPKLNFPAYYTFNIINKGGKTLIFDPARKKFVQLTPEEWVRQHIIRFLAEELDYPFSHMCVEKSLTLNQQSKRADLLVYDKSFNQSLLVECKAPEIKISDSALEQIARYNLIFKVPWMIVTNGLFHFFAYADHSKQKIKQVKAIPDYNVL